MRRALWATLLAATLPAATTARAASGSGVVGSKHDLSVTGPGPVKALTERAASVFCHVSHRGGPHGTNRPDLRGPIQPYRSSTMAGQAPSTPTGATRICLSCHDGTIALGETRTRRIEMNAAAPGGRMPPGRSLLGTDLRGTHPVSFRPVHGVKVHEPPPGDAVKLDRAGQLQCTSCHDPHREYVDAQHGDFLVKTPRSSALCLSCHSASAYQAAGGSHATSMAAPRPGILATTAERTVSEAGCLACHQSHGADERGRLVKPNPNAGDDRLCLDCHNGQVARLDVARQASKPYAHASPAGASAHDAGEGPASAAHRLPEMSMAAPRHAACVDCHDPHAATPRSATAPRASGMLAGVWGIDRNGNRVEPVQYQYEVCFKCHGDSVNQPQGRGPTPPETLRRALSETNLRRVFDPASPSSHPVVGPGRNPDVPSLLAPLSPSSVVYCTDCHASDEAAAGAGAPRGPHGSVYMHLLERNYSTLDGTAESPLAYALCYKCHDRNVLLSDRSAFRSHRRHVVDSVTPCSACHNSHGISALAGNPVNNAHLVDFDVSIVRPNARGLRQYTSRGYRTGSCALTCHGRVHDDLAY